MPLDGRPVIFVVPHPDDETLGAGVPIAEHVAAGRDVRILLLTRGTASNARAAINGTANPGTWWGPWHDPATEGYQPLSPELFGQARYDEMVAALGCLGVPADRIHEAGLLDTQVTIPAVKQAIVALADTLPQDRGDIGLWAPSYVVDDNPDHIAAGEAVRQLGAENPARWPDRRWWILPAYWTDARLSQVAEVWDTPTDATITARVRNACRAYNAWHPPYSFAIGYHSVLSMFNKMDGVGANPQPRAMIHRQ
ncbi:PIG-L deacetylase family protein [Micromonospora sp. NPDC020750]|uniref:PIG-L deacetylase family protein n=1 Tax=unclassified Micromonospora TaxID=2617518 RepID=UPI0037B6DC0E